MNGPPSETDLRFGVFLAPFHPLGESPTLLFERDLELISLLDRLGYDEAWIGEHHSGGFETIAAPEIFIAAAARETGRIRLGTGVKSLPYTHPFMLADAMVQLDHMTRGRAMFGVGPGALPSDAVQIGSARQKISKPLTPRDDSRYSRCEDRDGAAVFRVFRADSGRFRRIFARQG